MKESLEPETRINLALGVLLRNYNFLELNLGLCIRFLVCHFDEDKDITKSYSFLNRAGMSDLTSRLKILIDKCNHISNSSEYQQWMEKAERLRNLRNFYIHGTWEYIPNRKEGPLQFHLPPWRAEKIVKEQMTLEDLEKDVNLSKKIWDEFSSIRKKYSI